MSEMDRIMRYVHWLKHSLISKYSLIKVFLYISRSEPRHSRIALTNRYYLNKQHYEQQNAVFHYLSWYHMHICKFNINLCLFLHGMDYGTGIQDIQLHLSDSRIHIFGHTAPQGKHEGCKNFHTPPGFQTCYRSHHTRHIETPDICPSLPCSTT